jgi:polyhydroxyalkanoate synthesis regulator phasin
MQENCKIHDRRKMKMRGAFLILFLLAIVGFCLAQKDIDAKKAEAEKASGGHQAKLCSELAQELVKVADQQFTAGNNQQGQATVQDILKYASMARDAAVKSHSDLKQTEIRLRETQRNLENLKRSLSVEDRPPLDTVEKKIEQFRQDLLDTMFPPKKKDKKP